MKEQEKGFGYDRKTLPESGFFLLKRKMIVNGKMKIAGMALALGIGLTGTLPVHAEEAKEYKIYPIPQSVSYSESEFTLNSVEIVAEEEVDEYTLKFLKEVLDNNEISYTVGTSIDPEKQQILLGVEGSKGIVDLYADEVTISKEALYQENDAYLLKADQGQILIEGKDTDSVYFGIATLQMMCSSFEGNVFKDVQIEDYATIETRGFIEGFYGAWDFDKREDLMRFARDYKMDSYIYAAKEDVYHTSKWDVEYPPEMIEGFQKLVQVSKETKVEFGWAIHLGSFFSGLDINDTQAYNARFALLTNKLDQLYNIGVRKFDFLNDDFGSGSYDTVVTVLNRINREYIQAKGCEPMSYCPQGYNTAWSNGTTELESLKGLDEDIHIYWTGEDVNTPITQKTVDHVKAKTEHAPDYWLNFPVNEHAKSGIFLGDITYYTSDNVTGIAAFHSNPSRYAYANEVGLYQLASWTWNNADYNEHAQEIWESAFDYLQPEVKDAYFKIASNIANAPNSSRVSGFPESEYLQETIEAVTAAMEAGENLSDNEQVQKLRKEFVDILSAIEEFRENCNNEGLVEELDPWLKSLADICEAGRDILDCCISLESNDISTAWVKLSLATQHFDSAYTYSNAANQIAKAGSKRLYPFVSSALNHAEELISPILDTKTPSIYAKMGGVIQTEDANTKKIHDGDHTTYGGWQIVQQAGDYYGLDLKQLTKITDITIEQGSTAGHHDVFHQAVLQYSADGETWTDLEAEVSDDFSRIHVEGLNIEARYVRYYLKTVGYGTKNDYWTFVREFSVNEKKTSKVYTNVKEFAKLPLTYEDNEISLRDLTTVTLKSKEYVGIYLENPENVKEFLLDVSVGTQNFQDVASGKYYEKPVIWAIQNNVTKGVSNQLFGTKEQCTRAQIVTFLWRAAGCPKANTVVKFSDVKATDYFYDAVSWAVENNITKGTGNGKFSPKENCTRAQIVTFLWRNAGAEKCNQSSDFDDVSQTHFSYDAVNWAVQNKVTSGYAGTNLFKPQEECTRAEAVTFLYNAMNNKSSRIGLELEYSYNGQVWETAKDLTAPVGVKYVRLINHSEDTISLDVAKIGFKVQYLVPEAAFLNSTLTGGLTEGNYEDLFDGDLSTGVVTKGKHTEGSYMTFDLGKTMEVYDVQVVTTDGSDRIYNGKVQISADNQNWTDVAKVTNDNSVFEVPYRYISGNGNGASARYLRILLTGSNDTVLNLKEIQINKKIDASAAADVVVSNLEQDLTALTDGNIATAVTVNAKTGDYLEYRMSESTKIKQILVLQGAVGKGRLYTVTDQGKKELGTLSESVSVFDTSAYEAIYAFRIEWTEADQTAIHEITITADPAKSDDIGECVTPIIIETGERPIVNLALGKTAVVSGTTAGDKANVNDGDTSTKWDSNAIKNGSGEDIGDAWIYLDLEKDREIHQVVVSFFNKIYPTSWKIEVSADGSTWTAVTETMTKENNGATYPVETIDFETPAEGRYVRLYFDTINTGAAGHGIGITELEIYGK